MLKYNKLDPKISIAIKPLPNNLQSIVLPLMKISPKLILTGSTVLYMLDILERVPNDVDMALTESLTPIELSNIKDFFQFEISGEGKSYYNTVTRTSTKLTFNSEEFVKKPIIQFFKYSHNENEKKPVFKLDIFNKEYYSERDIYNISYNTWDGDFIIRMLHLCVTLGEKSKYAFDPRVGTASSKHMNDIKEIVGTKLDKYFEIIKNIEREKKNNEHLEF